MCDRRVVRGFGGASSVRSPASCLDADYGKRHDDVVRARAKESV
jgi:hypothetical protein